MFSSLHNLFLLSPFLWRTAWTYYLGTRPAKEGTYLRDLKLAELDKVLQARINYYVFLNRLINESLAVLRGYPLDAKEMELGMLMGAFTPVYDDLMDEHGYSHEAILERRFKDTPISRAYLQLYDRIRDLHFDFDMFLQYFNRAGIAQNDSLLFQRSSETSVEKLREIMRVKGGNFCLIFRSSMRHELSSQEEAAIYELGAMTQYVNDVFDVYKDFNQGTYTIPVKLVGDAKLRSDYYEALIACYKSFEQTRFTRADLRSFWLQVNTLLSRGLVAIDQYEAEGVKHGSTQLLMTERSALICDMEKPRNIIKNLKYTVDWKF